MNILNLDKGISLYEVENEFYFDLEDIADKLGYSRPKTAVQDFLKRNADFHIGYAAHVDGRKLYGEPVLYFFLMRSDSPKSLEWQKYVCSEVLPLVRKVGIKAIQELAAAKLLNQNKHDPELLPQFEKLLGGSTEQFLLEHNGYRVLGYLPPSEVTEWSLSYFWKFIEEVGIEEFDAIYVEKYHNSYTLDGKWYAFKPDDRFSTSRICTSSGELI